MANPPAWKSESRLSAKFIDEFDLEQRRWGYVVYRTIYTAESDANWDEAIRKLRAHVAFPFHYPRLQDPSLNLDPTPDQIAIDKLDLLVQHDPQSLDHADDQIIRSSFQTWVQANSDPQVSMLVCLVIDEECLASLLETPEPTLSNFTQIYRSNAPWVKVVARDYNENAAPPGAYYGWMRAAPHGLVQLYQDLQALEVEELWPFLHYEGQIPFWNGNVGGKLIDPPEGIEGRRRIGGTQRGAQGGTQRGSQGGTQRGQTGGTQRGTGGTQRGPQAGTQRGS